LVISRSSDTLLPDIGPGTAGALAVAARPRGRRDMVAVGRVVGGREVRQHAAEIERPQVARLVARRIALATFAR
jgi:hypothetical protein